jgi:hypothetical protein
MLVLVELGWLGLGEEVVQSATGRERGGTLSRATFSPSMQVVSHGGG